MTENKRFSVKKSGSGLFYRDGDYVIDNTIQFIIETVEMKLNQLSDENEQLKQQIEDCKDVNVRCCNDYSAMRRDVWKYKKENEQLKQRNEYLKKRCNEYWKEAGLNSDYFE